MGGDRLGGDRSRLGLPPRSDDPTPTGRFRGSRAAPDRRRPSRRGRRRAGTPDDVSARSPTTRAAARARTVPPGARHGARGDPLGRYPRARPSLPAAFSAPRARGGGHGGATPGLAAGELPRPTTP